MRASTARWAPTSTDRGHAAGTPGGRGDYGPGCQNSLRPLTAGTVNAVGLRVPAGNVPHAARGQAAARLIWFLKITQRWPASFTSHTLVETFGVLHVLAKQYAGA